MTNRSFMVAPALIACAFAVGQADRASQTAAMTKSPLGPNFPSNPPVLGARGLRPAPMSDRDVAEIRRIMNAQPFQAGNQGGAGQIHAMVGTKRALILYDSTGPYGYIGNLYARQLGALCTHFSLNCTLAPVEAYTQGTMNGYTATFYFGTTYNNPLPTGFLADAMADKTPLVWMGYNLWQIAWNASGANAQFTTKFGFQFNYMDGKPYSTVTYKGVPLTANPDGAGLANLTIFNGNLAKTLATASGPSGSSTPYLVRSGNLWFTAENPLEDAGTNRNPDRAAVIEDSIHDVINDGMTTGVHRAILRIDQVHAETQPAALTDIATYMAGTPYAVCVVPHYKDPMGHYTGGTAEDVILGNNATLVSALNSMVSKGATIVMQGDTHQYASQNNPNNGVSTDDMEFYRIRPVAAGDPEGSPTYGDFNFLGPTNEDSSQWVQAKLQDGLGILAANKLTASGWCTPMYMASLTDYEAIQSTFKYSLCRGNTFVADASGNVYFAPLCTPWPIVDDIGMARMPENVGYFSTTNFGVWEAIPSSIVQVASYTKSAIRDGWFGCYFHATYAVDLLETIVSGIKSNGFTFVSPGAQWVGQ